MPTLLNYIVSDFSASLTNKCKDTPVQGEIFTLYEKTIKKITKKHTTT